MFDDGPCIRRYALCGNELVEVDWLEYFNLRSIGGVEMKWIQICFSQGAALVASLPAITPLAHAADQSGTGAARPQLFSAKYSIELESDHTFSSTDPSAEVSDTYATINAEADFNLSDVVSAHADLVLEPVLDPGPFEDRFFRDHGGYLETLHLIVKLGNARLVAGKFNPGFGTAWEETPGIYGTEFAEDYQLTEKIGAQLQYQADAGKLGMLTFGAALYFADTSALSDSIITSRGQLTLADGGAGNTERLESVSVFAQGEELPKLPGLTYHLAVRHQEAGLGDAGDETGLAFGLIHEWGNEDDLQIRLNAEVAAFEHFQGGVHDALFVTGGVEVSSDGWLGQASFTARTLSGGPAGTNYDDRLFQFSVGRELTDDLTLSAGYKFTDVENTGSHTVGVLLAWEPGATGE